MSGAAARQVIRGISRLMRFRAAGLEDFTGTPGGFLNSLAPLLAFPILGAMLMLIRGGLVSAFAYLSVGAVVLLGPPVMSQLVAQWWKRDDQWLRYATAYNWCQVGAVVLFVPVIVIVLLVMIFSGVKIELVSFAQNFSYVMFAYLLALNLFLIWRGLRLSLMRSILFLVIVAVGSFALQRLPTLAKLDGGMLGGP